MPYRLRGWGKGHNEDSRITQLPPKRSEYPVLQWRDIIYLLPACQMLLDIKRESIPPLLQATSSKPDMPLRLCMPHRFRTRSDAVPCIPASAREAGHKASHRGPVAAHAENPPFPCPTFAFALVAGNLMTLIRGDCGNRISPKPATGQIPVRELPACPMVDSSRSVPLSISAWQIPIWHAYAARVLRKKGHCFSQLSAGIHSRVCQSIPHILRKCPS